MTEYDDLLARAQAVADLPELPAPDARDLTGLELHDVTLTGGDGPPAVVVETVADPATVGVGSADGGGASPDPESWRMVSVEDPVVDANGDIEVVVNVEPVYADPDDTPPATRSPAAHGAAILSGSPLVRDKAAEFIDKRLPDLPPPIGDDAS